MSFINLLAIISVLFILVAAFILWRYSRRFLIWQSLSYKLCLISVPRENVGEKQELKKFTELISGFEQFLASLANFKEPVILEIATPTESEEIFFYLAAPRRHLDLLEKNLSAYYPSARFEICDDYTIFKPKSFIAGARFFLADHFALPLRLYSSFDHDPLNGITNSLSQLNREDEGGAIQIILKPAEKEKKKQIENILQALRTGKKWKEALSENKIFQPKLLKEAFKTQDQSKQKAEEVAPKPVDENLIRNLSEKISRPLFYVNVRVIAASNDKERAKEVLSHLISPFKQLEAPNQNSLKVKEAKSSREINRLIFDFCYRIFRPREAMILNTAEITSFYHPPHLLIETPKIRWLRSRSAPAPVNLPTEGVILGENIFRGERKLVRIYDEDRRRHFYMIGQTGTGKTTLLKNMAIQDIKDGKGLCFIDPHGDVAEELLGYIPASRFEDVIYFNPADTKRAIGLNMLEWNKKYPFQKSFVANELLEIFDKLYDLRVVGGPVFEQYFRYGLLLLLEDDDYTHTLNDLSRVYVNADYRRMLLDRSPNPMVKEFWEKEAEKAGGELALANVAPYINSKLNPFLANDLVRPIISQAHSSLDFRKILDESKVLIVNLSKGLLGEMNSYLLGMIIMGKLMMAAFSRVDVLEEERRDFYVYIDEFQNITTNTISTIFAEARKYRLNLTVANQFLGQLKEEVVKSIFGNVGTILSFRISEQDAEILAKYFAPVFNNYDLINLDNFRAYLKMTIKGQISRAFDLYTFKGEPADRSLVPKLKEFSSLTYGRPIEEVENEIKSQYEIYE